MSYQFDASQIQVQRKIKAPSEQLQVRLLARRTNRQTRRALRAI